ncbi:MAG: hypothetical protein JXA93_24680 [Anaerolineae bacterium]|nr:hypothetical protein [Anaerolineae bacterium]
MTRARLRWLLVVAALFLWLVAVYAAYYVVHKPFGPNTLYALGDVAANLLTWLVLMAVAMGLGSRLTRRVPYHSPLERVVFSTGAGLVVLSLLTFFLALVGLLYGWLFWILMGVGVILFLREIAEIASLVRWKPRAWPDDKWLRFLCVYIVASLSLTLLVALTPPVEWDALLYHLVGPELYLRSHRFVVDLQNYCLFYPSFTEMLFTVGMGLKGDIVPRLIHFGYMLLTLGLLVAFGSRYWDRTRGLVAAALFVSIPTALQIASWAYVDLALTFYSFGALYALLTWHHSSASATSLRSEPAVGWLLLAGAFAGASLSIKYSGVSTLVGLGALLLFWLLRRKLTVYRFLAGSVVVVAVALAVGGAWYVKNALVSGNPVYPLIWGGREWNDISTRWLSIMGEDRSFLDILLVPWTLIVLGTQGTVMYDATFSPLFLVLVPLLLLVPRRGHEVVELSVGALVAYLFWIVSGSVSHGQSVLYGRLALPIFAPLGLLGAYALHGMDIWDRRALSLQRLLKVVVTLTLSITLASSVLLTTAIDPLRYLVGLQSRDSYLDQHVSQHFNQAVRYLNDNLDDRDRVLFLWEPRSYRVGVPAEPDVLLDNFSQRLALYGTAEALFTSIRREGFTYVLVNHHVYPWIVADFPITAAERAAWEEFRAQYLTDEMLVHAEEEYLGIYRLPPAEGE